MLKLVVLTSTAKRHRFLVNTLAREFTVVGVAHERKRPFAAGATTEEDEVMRRHLAQRDEAEDRYFQAHGKFAVDPGVVHGVPNGRINDPDVFDWVRRREPDYLVLFGTSIIRPPLLSFYDGRTVNLHLGLSPYYRGAGTNFWPLVNREPELVGATVHLAILNVDAGPLLAQARPCPDVQDRCHDLGCKTIIAGGGAMVRAIRRLHAREIEPVAQADGGRLYKRSAFNAEAVRTMWRNFETGMMEEYVARRAARDARFPILER